MKGVILAGGRGSRLLPLTSGISKQLLPVYNKPLIYYPISTLMLADIRDILVITTPQDEAQFKRILGDGSNYGVSFNYAQQLTPNGIAESILIAEQFIGNDSVSLILGDNVFYGQGLGNHLRRFRFPLGAHILACKVSNPSQYGVVEINDKNEVISIEEKPQTPKSSFAVTGLYFYDNSVIDLAKQVQPSERGELEISTLNNIFLQKKSLSVTVLERGTTWLDTGTFDDLHSASCLIKAIEDRQGSKVACLEEIAWRKGWIDDQRLLELASVLGASPYGKYVKGLLGLI
jgi:glucose-1-phosphate thymidylyltransferase